MAMKVQIFFYIIIKFLRPLAQEFGRLLQHNTAIIQSVSPNFRRKCKATVLQPNSIRFIFSGSDLRP